MALAPFGQQTLGEFRLGDGSGALRNTSASSLGLSYTIQPPATSLGITYNLQGFGAAPLLLSYWVVPPITAFSINGDVTIPKPHHMEYGLPTQVGYDLSGVAVVQGYTAVTWIYDELLDTAIAKLMAHYDPANPQVTVTYPNELGVWTQKQAMYIPPNLGARETIKHNNVQIVFTHIIPD